MDYTVFTLCSDSTHTYPFTAHSQIKESESSIWDLTAESNVPGIPDNFKSRQWHSSFRESYREQSCSLTVSDMTTRGRGKVPTRVTRVTIEVTAHQTQGHLCTALTAACCMGPSCILYDGAGKASKRGQGTSSLGFLTEESANGSGIEIIETRIPMAVIISKSTSMRCIIISDLTMDQPGMDDFPQIR